MLITLDVSQSRKDNYSENSPGMGTGLDDRDICRGEVPDPATTVVVPEAPIPVALGLEERESRFGVAGGVRGGVAPFPLARDSPIALTSSFTDTPCSSGGTSLDKLKINDTL